MRKPWDISFDLVRTGSTSLNVQIVQAFIERIRSGLLRPGDALPASRELASQLEVNRKTIVLAYEELTAQGWLIAQQKRGTFVSPQLPAVRHEARVSAVAQRLCGRLPEPGYQAYGTQRELEMPAAEGVVDFSDGAPDTRLVPFEDLSRAFRLALLESARGNRLGYGDPRGLQLLRQELAAMLRAERGLNADADTLCLVRGSQMGIYLAAKILVRPGDSVAMERLSYPPAREAFRACGGTIHSVEQDEFGMIPDSLERICHTRRIRAIYLTPHHQFPTTVTMPIDRRMRLLALAEQFDFVIIEDDYDHEFHFSHSPMLPMASVDQGGRVIYIGSLSKILAPGLRVGYVLAPPAIINRLANEIMLVDRQGNTVTERAAAQMMHSGKLTRHIRRALRVYEQRCRLAVEAVQEQLGDIASVSAPSGGLALWVRFNPSFDVAQLARSALAQDIRILPGHLFNDGGAPVSAMRLGYGSLNEQEFRQGIERLGQIIVAAS